MAACFHGEAALERQYSHSTEKKNRDIHNCLVDAKNSCSFGMVALHVI